MLSESAGESIDAWTQRHGRRASDKLVGCGLCGSLSADSIANAVGMGASEMRLMQDEGGL